MPSEIEWLRQQGRDFLTNYDEIAARNAQVSDVWPSWLQRSERLLAALSRLPSSHQRAVLARLDGASVMEIAEQLGMTPLAAAGHLHRAVLALRQDLGTELP